MLLVKNATGGVVEEVVALQPAIILGVDFNTSLFPR